ncbi:MAG TPA: excinuclease ABC subunit UvrC [Cyclobacteriaceae bacterium]|nr:excinuclease ABC subunit UvrC [Cyclobacteriaceae bacterium]
MKSTLPEIVRRLPGSPGVYKFFNEEGGLIYVGKAKNIRKRVTSYFNKISGLHPKTRRLVSEIRNIEYVLSESEFDALLLENNLIKQNQPKYNILLKDDKTFPYICILKERFPRIIYTRKYEPSQGEFFGPYSSVVAMKNVLDLIRKLYTIRTCNYLLSEANIASKKFKVCLEFHIGNCLGPCEGRQSEESYREEIEQARNILKGNLSVVFQFFRQQMQEASVNLEFERAQSYLTKLNLLEKFKARSLVVNMALTDIDVFAINSSEDQAYVNYFQVKEGAVVYSKSIRIKKKLDEPDSDVLAFVIPQMREEARSTNLTVFTNVPVVLPMEEVKITIPKIGDKRKLVDLSLKNALELRRDIELANGEKRSKHNEVLTILQRDMRLPAVPYVIECFDNSNFQGTTPVASLVRFVNGKPDKKGYRHFNIKTVKGPDDFASMKEIVGRRYRRLLDEGLEMPDLILVDGGKGQLSSACEALKELGLYGKVPVAGIAKKLEEIYYPEDPLPLHINKKSPGLLLLQRIRDEAHRFAITFHRKKRSKSTIKTDLESLPGIGRETANKLLKQFKSVRKIREASIEELAEVVGRRRAEVIKGSLQSAVGT